MTTPKSNREFWSRKFNENVARDHRKEQALRALGWTVEVIWECEILQPGVLEFLALNILATIDD